MNKKTDAHVNLTKTKKKKKGKSNRLGENAHSVLF